MGGHDKAGTVSELPVIHEQRDLWKVNVMGRAATALQSHVVSKKLQ
jgi:hypothetical protein